MPGRIRRMVGRADRESDAALRLPRTDVPVMVLRFPATDQCIEAARTHQRKDVRGLALVQAALLDELSRQLVPIPGWCVRAVAVIPLQRGGQLLRRARIRSRFYLSQLGEEGRRLENGWRRRTELIAGRQEIRRDGTQLRACRWSIRN